jgi:predicted HAD superfamily Cof-like phosphohydrolase
MDVYQFTSQSGTPCPDRPVQMTREAVMFITRMVMSELDELVCTVSDTPEQRDEMMATALESRDRCNGFRQSYRDEDELVGAQFDSLVDAWYYSLNVASKHGVNMSKIFDLVHKANMDKRDPETGQFLRRSDGKIIKPKGWQAPDITGEITRQRDQGAW